MAQPSWAIQGKLNESQIYKYVGRTPKQVTGLVLVTLLGLKVGREESIRDRKVTFCWGGAGLWWPRWKEVCVCVCVCVSVRVCVVGDNLADLNLFLPLISCQG